MKVMEIGPATYLVKHSNGRSWTAKCYRPGLWSIQNESGMQLRQDGRVGSAVVAAVEEFLK